MIDMIIWLIGLMLYAIFEGLTEASTWDLIDKNTLTYRLDQGKYHFYRAMETLGIVIMLFWVYSRRPLWGEFLFLTVGSLLFSFLVYRLAFILKRGQRILSPHWEWTIWIPIINRYLCIQYPPSWIVWISGIIGLSMIVANFWGF